MVRAVKTLGPVLLVDDDERVLRAVCRIIPSEVNIYTAKDCESALAILSEHYPEIAAVFLDLRLQGSSSGLDVLRRYAYAPHRPMFVIMSGFRENHHTREAMRLGADDFVDKPVATDDLLGILMRAAVWRQGASNEVPVSGAVDAFRRDYLPEWRGDHPKLQQAIRVVRDAADTRLPVLVTGESGTGKEAVARALHEASFRNKAPFVCLSCTDVADTLFESLAFGHARGAFTGAHQQTEGFFRAANKGTLFLDEIGDLHRSKQAKLLRALEAGEVMPVGETKSKKVDFRLVTATNRALEQLVEDGEFRGDLFHRINVLRVHLPPLRDRCSDIPTLAAHFIDETNRSQGKRIEGITDEALCILRSLAWPGNVRQLKHVVERMVVTVRQGLLRASDVPPELRMERCRPNKKQRAPLLPPGGLHFESTVREFERDLIREALERADGNKSKAAALLQMPRSTFQTKLRNLFK